MTHRSQDRRRARREKAKIQGRALMMHNDVLSGGEPKAKPSRLNP